MVHQKFLYKNDKHYLKKQEYFLTQFFNNWSIPKNIIFINVIGTNGKGSVANYIAYNLRKKYKKIGLFTSPHIFSARERIQVNNIPIDEEVLNQKLNKIEKYNLFYFQSHFYVALEYFFEQNCDVIVLEAAVGGKYDLTGCFANKYIILTSVAYDHLEILGNTKEEILTNKVLMVEGKKNITFYTGTNLKKLNTLTSKLLKKNNTKHIIVENDSKNYQKQNRLLASKFLKNEFDIKNPIFLEIFGRTTVFEVKKKINNVEKNFKLIIDVGHNNNGLEASLNVIKEKKINIKNVVLCLNKKKYIFDIKKLFKKKEIFVYNLNEEFIDYKMIKGSKNLTDIQTFIKNLSENTLFIGSFYFVSSVIDEKYFYSHLKKNEEKIKKWLNNK